MLKMATNNFVSLEELLNEFPRIFISQTASSKAMIAQAQQRAERMQHATGGETTVFYGP
jgi:hypothetical protein